MIIRNIRHKGLKRFVEADDSAGLPAAAIEKIRTIVAFLQAMATEDELHCLPMWKPHQLSGARKGTWALHATKNWRITFWIDSDEIEIIDLDFEDYH
jgi:toxin HigB-1